MKYDVVTLFPEICAAFVGTGLLARAVARGAIAVRCTSPREFAVDRHGSVDDTPYGGGAGMVLRPGPIADTLDWLDACRPGDADRAHRVLLTPQGAPLQQATVRRLVRDHAALALVCGRYEGFDERVRSHCDEEISLGDFVLMGGELAAMAVVEATARLVPGVLGNAASSADESHGEGLLEHPQYTRPATFRGRAVPEVLLSGDHQRVAAWRRGQALLRTRARRPDLFAAAVLSPADHALLATAEREPKS